MTDVCVQEIKKVLAPDKEISDESIRQLVDDVNMAKRNLSHDPIKMNQSIKDTWNEWRRVHVLDAANETKVDSLMSDMARFIKSKYKNLSLGVADMLNRTHMEGKVKARDILQDFDLRLRENPVLYKTFYNSKNDREIMGCIHALEMDKDISKYSGTIQDIAKVYSRATKELYNFERDAGVAVNYRKGWIMRNTTSISRILKGFKDDRAKAFEAWSADVLRYVDIDKTFGEGASQNLDTVKFELKKMFTEMDGRSEGRFVAKSLNEVKEMNLRYMNRGLDAQLETSRRFMFKSGEDFYDYNLKYGRGDGRLSYGLSSSVSLGTAKAATFRSFGSNPIGRVANLLDELGVSASVAGKVTSWSGAWNVAVKGILPVDIMKHYLPELMGVNRTALDEGVNKIFTWGRAVAYTSTLGSSLMRSFSDFASTVAMTQKTTGKNYFNTVADIVINFAKSSMMSKEDQIRLSGYLGTFLETSSAIQNSRLADAFYDASSTLANLQTGFYKLNLLEQWTRNMKQAAAVTISKSMADHAHLDFSALPATMRDSFDRIGITEKDWGILKHAIRDVDGVGKIISTDMIEGLNLLKIGYAEPGYAATASAARRLGLKFNVALNEIVDMAVPTPGLHERATLIRGTDPNDIVGQTVRSMAMFLSFPLAQMRSARFLLGGNEDNLSKTAIAAKFFLGITTAGYMGEVLRNYFLGNPQEKIDSPEHFMKTFGQNAFRSGAFGVFADLAYNKVWQSNLGGPDLKGAGTVMSALNAYANPWREDKDGNPIDRISFDQFSRRIIGTVPGNNLFYVRYGFDKMLAKEWYNMISASPDAFNKLYQRENERAKIERFVR